MRTKAIGPLALLLLSGCMTMPKPLPRPDFPVSEYRDLEGRKGTGRVGGQVFLRTRGGDVKVGAGSEVMLNPKTSYSSFWYENGYLANRPLNPPDARLDHYVLTTQADGSGNFRFENVPAGEYYLTSSVTWEAIQQWGPAAQGGWISEPITVEDGKEIRKMLTR